ncbi:DNA-binding transcriptional regulator, LacI/PurR family [Nocardioides terrae]|uniref:DNA-binding transcriptional regulator, LacI/PurR family n=1 Tax=Nocardioides terrae TaxID=574651 RepID=A0A1I1INQ0_9ACTN|nr:LacI family DNA-binding transcriptional regulator [Nocardioides terrae]SFC34860.1 DNA-binding transcriptional regulator, LacI/PurR family [Nocardioides terrae]
MTDQTQHAPLAPARRARVLAALHRDGVVRISELIDSLGVAPVTLRRDLAEMEREGLLRRVHGGAVTVQAPPARRGAPAQGAAPAAGDDGGAIAVLVPSLNYYWPGVVRGMEAEAQRLGLKLLLRGASYELQDERPVLERLITSEDIRGLIVAPNTDTAHTADVVQWLADAPIPAVLVERDAISLPGHEPMESVTTDHALGAGLAARHLAATGHREVGLVLSRFSPTSRKIAAGWHAACTELGLNNPPELDAFLPDRASPEFSDTVNATLDAALAKGVTGLLVHSDPEAMAVIDLALIRGISVPGDLSVVAYDDEVAQLFSPALTAVSPPRHAVGEAAVDLLAKRLANPDRPVHRVALSPELNVRASTAAAPGA